MRTSKIKKWRSRQLLPNKFFDPSTPSMRKGRDREENGMENGMENNGENSVPLTLLPVDRLTATDCNAAARANLLYAIGYQISFLIWGV